MCDGCTGECKRSEPHMLSEYESERARMEAVAVVNLTPGSIDYMAHPDFCPACNHKKHTGNVCGAEINCTVNGDGFIEPVRCPCHEESRKASRGKVKGFHLLPWDVLERLAKVYEFGATKYEAESWRKVPAVEYENAMFRHWKAVKDGKIWDEDAAERGFQIKHIDQFVWNAVAVSALTREGT